MFVDTTMMVAGASIVAMIYLMFRVYMLDKEMDMMMQKHNDFVEHCTTNFEALKGATLQIADWIDEMSDDSEDV
jgi:hypothetical protein